VNERQLPVAAAVLLGLGLLQMAADAASCTQVKGLAAATQLSPAPKVFSSVRGYETFSTRFVLEGEDDAGTTHRAVISPERYAHVRGPYQRRNIYGAALSYGPVLPATMVKPVMRFALCGDAPLVRELGLTPADFAHRIRVRFETRDDVNLADLRLPDVLVAPCGPS
jgi:hypothetical protein